MLSPSALLELDESGDTIAARELTTPGGESLWFCRDLHVDAQDRWWGTGTVDGDELERYPWLLRFGVDGTPEARLLPVEGEHYLGPIGDLAWMHDLTTEHEGTGRVAASEDVILTWLGSHAPTENEPSTLFAVDVDGDCICEQPTTLSGSVAVAAAAVLGPDTFLVLGETENETHSAQTWLARLHVAR